MSGLVNILKMRLERIYSARIRVASTRANKSKLNLHLLLCVSETNATLSLLSEQTIEQEEGLFYTRGKRNNNNRIEEFSDAR